MGYPSLKLITKDEMELSRIAYRMFGVRNGPFSVLLHFGYNNSINLGGLDPSLNFPPFFFSLRDFNYHPSI